MAAVVTLRTHHYERRRFGRVRVETWLPDLVVRVRPGVPVRIRELSAGGCVIDVNRSLLPGNRVELAAVSSFGRQLVRALVVRCQVGQISASMITFAAALQFDETVRWEELIPSLTWTGGDSGVSDTNGHQLPAFESSRMRTGTQNPKESSK